MMLEFGEVKRKRVSGRINLPPLEQTAVMWPEPLRPRSSS